MPGIEGRKGERGYIGLKGDIGLSGPVGFQGEKGDQGLNALFLSLNILEVFYFYISLFIKLICEMKTSYFEKQQFERCL